LLHRVIQEESSIFGYIATQGNSGGNFNTWKVTVPVIVRKNSYEHLSLILNDHLDTVV
jgi:hypothetical protein